MEEDYADDFEPQYEDVKPLPTNPNQQKKESEHRVKYPSK